MIQVKYLLHSGFQIPNYDNKTGLFFFAHGRAFFFIFHAYQGSLRIENISITANLKVQSNFKDQHNSNTEQRTEDLIYIFSLERQKKNW